MGNAKSNFLEASALIKTYIAAAEKMPVYPGQILGAREKEMMDHSVKVLSNIQLTDLEKECMIFEMERDFLFLPKVHSECVQKALKLSPPSGGS